MSRVSRFFAVILIVFSLAAVGSCGGGGGGGAAGGEFDSQLLNDNRDQIQADVTAATLIFAGTITSIGTAPTFWSGIAWSSQGVTYTVDSVIKGDYTDSSIDVYHVIVDDTRHASTTPGLTDEIFVVGGKLIVFVKQNPDLVDLGTGFVVPNYMDFDPNFGTIPYSAQNEGVINSMTASASEATPASAKDLEIAENDAGNLSDKTLVINGSDADKQTFNDLLDQCKEQSNTLNDLVSMIQNSEDFTVTLNLVNDAENVFVDSFNGKQVDVKDLQDWHAGCDDKTERCQLFGHFLQEYWHDAVTGDGYEKSHESALQTEDQIRSDMGKTTTGGNHTGVRRDGDLYMYTVYNGTAELVKIVGGNKPGPGEVTTETVPPVAPTMQSADGSTPCQITITWADNSTNEDGFQLQWREQGSETWESFSPLDPNTTTFVNSPSAGHTNLAPGKTYCYRVRSFRYNDPAVYSAWSSEACATKQ